MLKIKKNGGYGNFGGNRLCKRRYSFETNRDSLFLDENVY